MNNFNLNNGGAGNQNSDQHRPLSNVSPDSRSMFGFHEFSSNFAAHSFLDMALNRGNGFHGGIAAAFEIPSASSSGAPRLPSQGDFPAQFNSPGLSPTQGYFGEMNPIGLHPHPLHSEVLPPPDSVMFVLATVDEPSLPSGQRRQSQSQHGSGNGSALVGGLDGNFSRNLDSPLSPPLASNVSEASSPFSPVLRSHHSSASSRSSGWRCSCDVCRKCVCHLYCSRHAVKKCPVHGLSGYSGTPMSSSAHSAGSRGSFDSEFGESQLYNHSRPIRCQFCICDWDGVNKNCAGKCGKNCTVQLH